MQLTNNQEKFGFITKLLHWGVFALFCTQYFLIYKHESAPKDSLDSLEYLLLHKSFGLTLFTVALFFIFWKILNTRPSWPATMSRWQKLLAKTVHVGLFFSMLAMPTSGFLMSQFGGNTVSFFGHALPHLVSVNKNLSALFFGMHQAISLTILGLVIVHIVGALVHHFYYRDKVLTNML